MRDSLTFLWQTAGIKVRGYPSAGAFLDALGGAQLKCVITDVRMPGMSGIDLLRRPRELKIDVPVIVITGHGDVPLAVEAMKIARRLLEKPFDDDALLASVRSPSSARTATPSAAANGRISRRACRHCQNASATYSMA